ncbi:MAG: sulfate adenylyltransferase [Candidatus Thermoplasmatota archaeon]|nr:sulfate adenylyltransferase [Candidatus Thermoplasmatota archaeon]
MIPSPYGGKLVNGIPGENELLRRREEASEIPAIKPLIDQIYDAEKICTGAYSPLEGFMGREDFKNVLDRSMLSNGMPWTMPIFLAPAGKDNEAVLKEAGESDMLSILDTSGIPFAIIRVGEKFTISREEIAKKIYGTTDKAHPNVSDLSQMGEIAISGKVQLIRMTRHTKFEYTPLETRELFQKNGWRNVAGYQARNPPHTAHEYIQRATLERDDIDALFIQPVIGKLKKGDYRPEVIMEAYEVFVSHYYRSDRVLLASLSISMRYAGPKAVLFYAIVRRNFGCSHYIVGRDQAGVGSYYDPYAGHRIFDNFDVGIVPLKYEETFYCKVCNGMASRKVCPHGDEFHENTSQTRIRKLLSEGKPLPSEILRPEVAEVLRKGDVINN